MHRSPLRLFFWLLTALAFAGLLLPFLFHDGMFLDGLTYASISRNMSEGIGSLWKPHYTATLYPSFYEHPPLVFGIQSLFFRVLGDGIMTERLYSLSTALMTVWGIVAIWKLFSRETRLANYSWLPVLLWIMTPVVFWSYRNNMLENTLTPFTLFAIWFLCKATLTGRYWWLLPASLLIFASFLSKGPVGLFPLVTIPVYALSVKKIFDLKDLSFSTLAILLPIFFLLILFWVAPDAKISLQNYLNSQLIPSLSGSREVTSASRFTILYYLLLQMALPIILWAVFRITAIRRRPAQNVEAEHRHTGLFLILVGLSASLPLIITMKQRDFYLVPAIPYLILGISFYLAPLIEDKLKGVKDSIWRWISIPVALALISILAYTTITAGKPGRDQNMVNDVRQISTILPEGAILQTSVATWQNWKLAAYLARYGNISLDCDSPREYILVDETIQDKTFKIDCPTDQVFKGQLVTLYLKR
ncbi:MAG: glycosyltransferase family 39 protein [Bacteroidales bacterium]|nr:glycosyltransferase family 39 protein [Bacteroidales bacterium]